MSLPPPPRSGYPDVAPIGSRHDWMGPAEGWLGGLVPVRLVMARTDERLIVIDQMTAQPTGVDLTICQIARVRDGAGFGPFGLGEDTSEHARIGVAYADGTSWNDAAGSFRPSDVPTSGPMVRITGAHSSGLDFGMRAWLWPLPPVGPVTFSFAWPSAGIDEATVVVDGSVFRDAADRAERIWDDAPARPLRSTGSGSTTPAARAPGSTGPGDGGRDELALARKLRLVPAEPASGPPRPAGRGRQGAGAAHPSGSYRPI